jgi:hypothetical protein
LDCEGINEVFDEGFVAAKRTDDPSLKCELTVKRFETVIAFLRPIRYEEPVLEKSRCLG